MQKSHSNPTVGITWLKRLKIGVAGLAFAAAAVLGGIGMSAPEPPQPEEEAGLTWSYSLGGTKSDVNSRAVTWS